jgi:hypothetical protein
MYVKGMAITEILPVVLPNKWTTLDRENNSTILNLSLQTPCCSFNLLSCMVRFGFMLIVLVKHRMC